MYNLLESDKRAVYVWVQKAETSVPLKHSKSNQDSIIIRAIISSAPRLLNLLHWL